jgi:hypothetical protein
MVNSFLMQDGRRVVRLRALFRDQQSRPDVAIVMDRAIAHHGSTAARRRVGEPNDREALPLGFFHR